MCEMSQADQGLTRADKIRTGDLEIYEAKSKEFFAYCIFIRTQVFINGQPCALDDEIDSQEEDAKDFIGIMEGYPVATARYRILDESTAIIERVAVLEEDRKKGYGADIIKHVAHTILERGVSKVVLSTRMEKTDFYRKIGFRNSGEPYQRLDSIFCMMEYKLGGGCTLEEEG